MTFRRVSFIILSMLAILSVACEHNDWDDVPSPIQNFISQYFPFGSVSSSVTSNSGDITVYIDNGATLLFDKDYAWIKVNGNGVPLPNNFLFDKLPERLYAFLLETDQTNSVFAVTRNDNGFIVELHDTNITYDISTGVISYPKAP